MRDELPTLDPPERLLCGPGPSNVEPSVLEAMRKPMLGHLDPDLSDILLDVVDMLRRSGACRTGSRSRSSARAPPGWRRG